MNAKSFFDRVAELCLGGSKKQKKILRHRTLLIEPCESRELLSVSPLPTELSASPVYSSCYEISEGEYGKPATTGADESGGAAVYTDFGILQASTYSMLSDMTLGGSVLDKTVPPGAPTANIDDHYSFQLNDLPKHGTLVFHADGSFVYQADTGYRGAEALSYSVLDSEGNVIDESVILIQVRPKTTVQTPLSAGFHADPTKDDFGQISIAGNGVQINATSPFVPIFSGNHTSSVDVTRNTEPLALQAVSITVCTSEDENGDWVYSEIASYSYNFTDGDDAYYGGYAYVLSASYTNGIYESLFVLSTSDNYRVTEHISNVSGTSSFEMTTTYFGGASEQIFLVQSHDTADSGLFVTDTRTSRNSAMMQGLGSYSYATEGGSVTGRISQSGMNLFCDSVTVLLTGSESGFTAIGFQSTAKSEHFSSRYAGSGTYETVFESENSFSQMSGTIAEHGSETRNLTLNVHGTLGSSGTWIRNGSGMSTENSDDSYSTFGSGNYSRSGGTPGNNWAQSGTQSTSAKQVQHEDSLIMLTFHDNAWTVFSGRQNSTGNSSYDYNYDGTGIYTKTGNSAGYSWTTSGITAQSGENKDSSDYKVNSIWLAGAWKTTGKSSSDGSDSSNYTYEGAGTYASKFEKDGASYDITGITTENGDSAAKMSYTTEGTLIDGGTWATSGTAQDVSNSYDSSSYDGSGTFKMPIHDPRIVGNAEFFGKASQNGSNESTSDWSSDFVLQNDTWLQFAGLGTLTEAEKSLLDFNGTAYTNEKYTEDGVDYTSSTKRFVDGKNINDYNTTLYIGFVDGLWETLGGFGTETGETHFSAGYDSSGTYKYEKNIDAIHSKLSGSFTASGEETNDSDYDFALFWLPEFSWTATGEIHDKNFGKNKLEKTGKGTFSIDTDISGTKNHIEGTILEKYDLSSSFDYSGTSERQTDGTEILTTGYSEYDRFESGLTTYDGNGEFHTSSTDSSTGDITKLDGTSTYFRETKTDYSEMAAEYFAGTDWSPVFNSFYKDVSTDTTKTSQQGSGTITTNGDVFDVTVFKNNNSETVTNFSGLAVQDELFGGIFWIHDNSATAESDFLDKFTTILQTKEVAREITGGSVLDTINESSTKSTSGDSKTSYKYINDNWLLQSGKSTSEATLSYTQAYNGTGTYFLINDYSSIAGVVTESGEFTTTATANKIVSNYDAESKKWVDTEKEGEVKYHEIITFLDESAGTYKTTNTDVAGLVDGTITKRKSEYNWDYKDVFSRDTGNTEYAIHADSNTDYAAKETADNFRGFNGTYEHWTNDTRTGVFDVTYETDDFGYVISSDGTRSSDGTGGFGMSFTMDAAKNNSDYDSWAISTSENYKGDIKQSLAIDLWDYNDLILGYITFYDLIWYDASWETTSENSDLKLNDSHNWSKTATQHDATAELGGMTFEGTLHNTEQENSKSFFHLTYSNANGYTGDGTVNTSHFAGSAFTGIEQTYEYNGGSGARNGSYSNGNSTTTDLEYTWLGGPEKWHITGVGFAISAAASNWSDIANGTHSTGNISRHISFSHSEGPTAKYEYDNFNTASPWTLVGVIGGGGGVYSNNNHYDSHTETDSVMSDGSRSMTVHYVTDSREDRKHGETWNVTFDIKNGKVVRETDGTVTETYDKTWDYTANGSNGDSQTTTTSSHTTDAYGDTYDYTSSNTNEWSLFISDSQNRTAHQEITTKWSNKSDASGKLIYEASAESISYSSNRQDYDFKQGSGYWSDSSSTSTTVGNDCGCGYDCGCGSDCGCASFSTSSTVTHSESKATLTISDHSFAEETVKREASTALIGGKFFVTETNGTANRKYDDFSSSNFGCSYERAMISSCDSGTEYSFECRSSSYTETHRLLHSDYESTWNGVPTVSEINASAYEEIGSSCASNNGLQITRTETEPYGPISASGLSHAEKITTANQSPSGVSIVAPSRYGTLTIADDSLEIQIGKPNFSNFKVIDTKALLQPPALPSFSIDNMPGVSSPNVSIAGAFFGSLATSLYDMANHLTAGQLEAFGEPGGGSPRYDAQVEAAGERLYNVAKNLGYSDESIASGVGLAQALAGEVVGTNELAESMVGFDIGANEVLDGAQRAEKAVFGGLKAIETVAGGLQTFRTLNAGATSTLKDSCFLKGTLISRYSTQHVDKKELVSIEKISVGDIVWSCDPRIAQWHPKPVMETFETTYVGDIVTISIGNAQVSSTGGHPFWVATGEKLEERPPCDVLPTREQSVTTYGRWIYARDIRVGDKIAGRSLNDNTVTNIDIAYDKLSVYNLAIDELHAFAVGEFEALVHNNCQKPTRSGAGRSDPHGDSGRLAAKSAARIAEMEKEIERLKLTQEPGRKKAIQNLEKTIKNMNMAAERAKKGETHWRK